MRRSFSLLSSGLLFLLITACGGDSTGTDTTGPARETPAQQAARLAQELIIVDTHIDVPYRLRDKMEDISTRTESGDFDFPRAQAGGLNAAFMSIYVPAKYQQTGGAREVADQLIDMVEGFERDHPDKFAIARSTADVRRLFVKGVVALPLGMENGAPIESMADLEHFYQRGVRYITLTHSENNQICDSSYAKERQWSGLSDLGRQVVAEMNRLGIMIDVSHVSDDAFYQVLEITEAPVIASHSSCREFTPGWERNMDDDMIRALADNGGVIQINFGSAFLRGDAQQQSSEFWAAATAYGEENGYSRSSPEMQAFSRSYWQEKERVYADLDDVVAHVKHVADLVGVDHIGFGSDFDGVGDSLPTGLKDVSDYPNLLEALLAAGFSEADLEKFAGGNALRVWGEVEAVARRHQSGS